MKIAELANTDVARSTIYRGMPQFPGRLVKVLGDRSPLSLSIAGSAELLGVVDSGQSRSVGVAASVDAPASIFETTAQLVHELADRGAVFVGGFHSPLERKCLDLLVAAERPAIVCLGRTLEALKVPVAWLALLRKGKLMLISACGPSQKRASRESVRVRNACVAALSDTFVVPQATEGGRTEALCSEILKSRKTVWTLNQVGNGNLVAIGARLATAENASEILDLG